MVSCIPSAGLAYRASLSCLTSIYSGKVITVIKDTADYREMISQPNCLRRKWDKVLGMLVYKVSELC